jgi:hypothetical protein
MLIHKIQHEESNHGGHCNSHDRNDYDRNLIFP